MPPKPVQADEPPGMHPADIVASVRKMGTNLSRLALENGLGSSTLRVALLKPHPRANRLIARTIGKTVHELWPLWFDTSGKRIPKKRHPATAPRRESSQSPKKQAA